MQKFLENLEKSEKILQKARHLTYMTYPLVKDKRLLLRILIEIKNSVAGGINSALQYEYIYKRIKLNKNPGENLRTFIQKCCPKYKISEIETAQILNIFELSEKHKKSPFEFAKNEKIIILSENMSHETISVEKIKEFLETSKIILHKIKDAILR